MKVSKKLTVAFAVMCVGLFGNAVYASGDVPTTPSNVKVVDVKKDEKAVEMIVSDDKYVRINPPTKDNVSVNDDGKISIFTFEGKGNIAGETNQGTDIVIKVYNTTDKDNISLPKEVAVYELPTVGVTKTFNQLIDLAEGKNTVVVSYSNSKDKIDGAKVVFYITRESEEKKEKLKSTIIIPQLNK